MRQRTVRADVDLERHVAHVISRVRSVRKNLGVFFTPQWVVDFVVSLIDERTLDVNDLKVLEPACGICQFLAGIKRNKRHVFERAVVRVGVEVSKEIVEYARERGLTRGVEVVCGDYLLWDTEECFDVVVGNSRKRVGKAGSFCCSNAKAVACG